MVYGYTNSLAIKSNLEKIKPFKREKKIRGKSDALFAASYFIFMFHIIRTKVWAKVIKETSHYTLLLVSSFV